MRKWAMDRATTMRDAAVQLEVKAVRSDDEEDAHMGRL